MMKKGQNAWEPIEKKIRQLENANIKLVKELEAAELYDKMRGITTGEFRKRFTLQAVEQNKAEIANLEEKVATLKKDGAGIFSKLFSFGSSKLSKAQTLDKPTVLSLKTLSGVPDEIKQEHSNTVAPASDAARRYSMSRKEEDFTGRPVQLDTRKTQSVRLTSSLDSVFAPTQEDGTVLPLVPPMKWTNDSDAGVTLSHESTATETVTDTSHSEDASSSETPTTVTATPEVSTPEAPLKQPIAPVEEAPAPTGPVAKTYAFEGRLVHSIPYTDLSKRVCPVGVDPLHREEALSDDEFLELFNMGREAFEAQPAWKKEKQKKALKLF